MPYNRTLQSTLAFCRPFLGYQPLLVNGLEPALTAANLIKQTMLGPPFAWSSNRGETVIPIVVGQSDYPVVVKDYGFVETWNLVDAAGSGPEIQNATRLAKATLKERPSSIAVQTNDGNGNLLVRLNNLPDVDYDLTLTYQKKPVLLLSPASSWYPLGDDLAYIYEWGFLSIASLLIRDDRYPIFRQSFLSHLLGAQDGIDATQRNIFLGSFLDNMKMMERSQAMTQQANAGRVY